MFLLIMFLVAQGLVEVVTSSDGQISVRATILLGELLHMVLHCFRSVNRAHYIFTLHKYLLWGHELEICNISYLTA